DRRLHLHAGPIARDRREREADDLFLGGEVVGEMPAGEPGLVFEGADGAGADAVPGDDLDRRRDDVRTPGRRPWVRHGWRVWYGVTRVRHYISLVHAYYDMVSGDKQDCDLWCMRAVMRVQSRPVLKEEEARP